jgi:hypothetical protein
MKQPLTGDHRFGGVTERFAEQIFGEPDKLATAVGV